MVFAPQKLALDVPPSVLEEAVELPYPHPFSTLGFARALQWLIVSPSLSGKS